MPDLLFIYGTLHPDRAPREIAPVVRRLIPRGPAQVRGRVYYFGDYPGLLLDGEAPPVSGELFGLPDSATLTLLDAYEEFRPASPQTSLFLRVDTAATLPDGSSAPCWVYVYNQLNQ